MVQHDYYVSTPTREMIMRFTATQLRQDSSKVFNEVQLSGQAKIVSRSRPTMILMTEDELEKLVKQFYEYGRGVVKNDDNN